MLILFRDNTYELFHLIYLQVGKTSPWALKFLELES